MCISWLLLITKLLFSTHQILAFYCNFGRSLEKFGSITASFIIINPLYMHADYYHHYHHYRHHFNNSQSAVATGVLLSSQPDPTKKKKDNWKFAIFRPTRRLLLPQRPGQTENVLIFFLSGLQQLEFGRCSFFSFLVGLRTYQHPGRMICHFCDIWLQYRRSQYSRLP